MAHRRRVGIQLAVPGRSLHGDGRHCLRADIMEDAAKDDLLLFSRRRLDDLHLILRFDIHVHFHRMWLSVVYQVDPVPFVSLAVSSFAEPPIHNPPRPTYPLLLENSDTISRAATPVGNTHRWPVQRKTGSEMQPALA